jgi:hypothetical protein
MLLDLTISKNIHPCSEIAGALALLSSGYRTEGGVYCLLRLRFTRSGLRSILNDIARILGPFAYAVIVSAVLAVLTLLSRTLF